MKANPMTPKPKHLAREYAEQFKDQSIVDAYEHRPTYPDEAIQILVEQLRVGPRAVLDVGCGTGDIARRLAPLVERVDAVDFSESMLERGKTLPGGNHPNLHWILGAVEEAKLSPPYGMVTAGASIHWLDWLTAFRLFDEVLASDGKIAIVEMAMAPVPWQPELSAIISKFSTNRDYQTYNIYHELKSRNLFEQQEDMHTEPIPFLQSIDNYIESFHARNGLSRDRMTTESAAAFDFELRTIVLPYCPDELIRLKVSASVVFGIPVRSVLSPWSHTNQPV